MGALQTCRYNDARAHFLLLFSGCFKHISIKLTLSPYSDDISMKSTESLTLRS